MDNISIENLIDLKDMFLIGEFFDVNIKREFKELEEKENIEVGNHIQISSEIGNDKGKKDKLIYKIGFNIIQAYEDINTEKNRDDYISKLEIKYICVFQMHEDCIDQCMEIKNNKSNDLAMYMLNVIYPYMKEHIENIYKKASVPIKLPLKLQ